MSKVLLAGFTDEGSVADFIRRISDATVEALLSLPSARADLPTIPIVQVRRIATGNRRLYNEYNQYSSLFYLNEAALEMCKDLNVEVSVVGEADAMTEEASFDLEAYYIPLAQRGKAKPKPLADEITGR
jgi:hypothetical protein